MKCDDIRNEIVLLVAKELSDADERRVEEHIASCPSCGEFAAGVRRALVLVQEARSTHRAVDLWPGVRARLQSAPSFAWQKWALAPALGVILAGGVFLAVNFHYPGSKAEIADLEIVKDLEFLTDYELWEDLDTLEAAELPAAVQEA